jgi:hypothetical protein
MAAQIILLSAHSLLVRARRPYGGTVRIAGWVGRANDIRTKLANPARAWVVFIGSDGEGLLIRSFASLFQRRVLDELFEFCAVDGRDEARRLYPQRCWLCRGDDFIPEIAAFALQRVALKAGQIPHDVARRAGIPMRYLAGRNA